MRIEINAGGLQGTATLSQFEEYLTSLLQQSETTIAGWNAIRSSAYNANGGVGNLQSAVDSLGIRIAKEEANRDGLLAVQKQYQTFLEHAQQTDRQVAEMVAVHQDEFYQANPWAKPTSVADTTTKSMKEWYGSAETWLNLKCTNSIQINNGTSSYDISNDTLKDTLINTLSIIEIEININNLDPILHLGEVKVYTGIIQINVYSYLELENCLQSECRKYIEELKKIRISDLISGEPEVQSDGTLVYSTIIENDGYKISTSVEYNPLTGKCSIRYTVESEGDNGTSSISYVCTRKTRKLVPEPAYDPAPSGSGSEVGEAVAGGIIAGILAATVTTIAKYWWLPFVFA